MNQWWMKQWNPYLHDNMKYVFLCFDVTYQSKVFLPGKEGIQEIQLFPILNGRFSFTRLYGAGKVYKEIKIHSNDCSESKLANFITTSLKTCQYFLLERCWNLLSCESAKTFIIITKIYYKFHCNMGLISHLFIIPSITFLCATTTCLKVFLSQMSSNALIQSPN